MDVDAGEGRVLAFASRLKRLDLVQGVQELAVEVGLEADDGAERVIGGRTGLPI